jgi:hypothetical protein
MLKYELRRGVWEPTSLRRHACPINHFFFGGATPSSLFHHMLLMTHCPGISRGMMYFPARMHSAQGWKKGILFDQWRMRDNSTFVAIVHFEQIGEFRLVAALLPIVDSSSLLTHGAEDVLREQAGIW